MKKLLSVIIALTLAFMLFSGIQNASADEITVELDGEKIEFDVKPEIIDGRTMVPLRKIFEALGASVKWNGETQTVSARKSSKTVTLTIDSAELAIDKGKTDDDGNPVTETVTLDVPAKIISGRTLVPARAISESFGLDVDWDEEAKKVVITSDSIDDDSWKKNTGSINLTDLTFEGDGVQADGNNISITKGGDFTVTGTLENGSITISATEKVKLRLAGAKITSVDSPCIYAEDADKVFITLNEGTENYLISENAESGALYSKEDLEIKGKGTLCIESAGHGIKASDDLTIENGTVSIKAESDGVHVNDTFSMTGGALDITAAGDGIDSESIVDISGGTVNIETTGTPVNTETQSGGISRESTNVEFEKSTKGINAEWMLTVSGGEITVDSASHAIHCADETDIEGGSLTLSSEYGKGISAHGNLTISGADTVIDIEKSTEGLESKSILTVNDGTINIVASDDAINATGGNSGNNMPGGGFGGGNREMPEGENGGQGFQKDGQEENGGMRRGHGARGQRGENGEAAPPEMSGDGEAAQPGMRQGGRGAMPGMPQGGDFTPPEMPQNGNFTPPEMPQNGDFTPPEMSGDGNFTPPEMPQDGNIGRPEMPQNGSGSMPGGAFGSRGSGKTCLIINGGSLELCAKNDCLDANGSLEINGGTIKATDISGSFSGPFAVIDPDGQAAISENASLIFAAAGGSAESLGLSQNTITVYPESAKSAGDKITLSDKNGNTVYEYTPKGSYKAVMIASNSIKTGEKYTVSVGGEAYEAEITGQNTVIGTQSSRQA